MKQLGYSALCLDLDGTLVDPNGEIRESTKAAIALLRETGVRVMITTGRSVLGAEAIIEELDLREPAVVFNGGGVWCPKTERLLEEQILAERVVDPVLDYAAANDHYVCVMLAGKKFVLPPKDALDEATIAGLGRFVPGLKVPSHLKAAPGSSRARRFVLLQHACFFEV